jgi:CelD/BcsL family acetyltransferase involved in cellulose biosynthesis
VAELPTNPWQPSGELLVDENAITPQAMDLFVRELRSLKLSLFDFGITLPNSSRWRFLVDALSRQAVTPAIAPRFEVALVDGAADWHAQSASWSTNHRRRVKRNQKLLDTHHLQVEFHELRADRESIGLLDETWRLESLSWKGAQGDAVAHDSKLVDFYREQAMLLSEAKNESVSSLVAVLKRDQQLLAAMYYWISKEVGHLWKSAYDPEAADLSPGSLLLQEVLRMHIERGDCRLFNLMGEMSPAHASFATRKFDVARLVFAGNSGIGRAAVGAYRVIRRLRGKSAWQTGALSEPWPLSTSSSSPAALSSVR